jgi:photosystem II stability/assembly factor-like uncharacterized protein
MASAPFGETATRLDRLPMTPTPSRSVLAPSDGARTAALIDQTGRTRPDPFEQRPDEAPGTRSCEIIDHVVPPTRREPTPHRMIAADKARSPLRPLIAPLLALAMIALTPGVADGAVPKANWYWSMVASGSNANMLLLGTSNGLYRSTDDGKTWRAAGFSGVNATSLVRAGTTIFLGGVRESAANPIVTRGGNYLVSPGSGVLAASSDGGKTWRELHPRGLPNLELAALAVDPANSRVVYAVLRNGAVYRSPDRAGSFQLVTAKIGGTPWTLAITQDSHLVGGNMSTGSYLSANGKAWHRSPFVDPRGTYMVMELAVDPAELKHVLMTSFGIMVSTDSGKSWRVALKSKVMFGPVAYASGTAVAYAVGFDGSFWRSSDRGNSWTRVP